MHKKEIEIDLSKSKNTIVVFDGPNGSGKTSILSMMHPFAYVGSMDIRNNSSTIIDGEDGFKEIHITHNGNLYKIQHYYKNSATRGITLKSFIQKDGIELNPNGNVTSFTECVKQELSIELDFLRLIRLGSNVSNLIDMKSTERKNYAAYLLSDINVYTAFFKKINEDNRLIKNLMKTVTEKLERLHIVDIDLVNKEIEDMENSLKDFNERKSQLLTLLGTITGKIATLAPDGVGMLYDNKSTLNSELEEYKKIINKNLKSIDSSCIILTTDIDTSIEHIRTIIQSIDNSITSSNEMTLFYKEQMSQLYDERDNLSTKLATLSSDMEYHQITNFHVELKLRIKDMEKKYKNFEKTCTKDEYMLILNTITQINSIMSNIYEFNNKSIKKCVELMKGGINIESHVAKELTEVDKKILKITSQFKSGVLKNPVVIFKPHNCEVNECPYLYLYDLLFSNSEEKSSLASLESEKEMLNDVLNIHTNINYIFMTLKSIMSVVVKGQLKFLTVDNVLDTIYNGDLLNYEDYITNLISEVEEYDSYITAKEECKKIENEIKLINANKGNIDELLSQVKDKDLKIAEISKNIKTIEDKVSILTKDKLSNEELLESYIDYKDKMEEVNNYTNQLANTVNKLDDVDNVIRQINELMKQSETTQCMLNDVNWNIEKLSKQLTDRKFSIKEFENLTEERNKLNDQFDDLNIIRESLSSTKGIPLLFIQLYLKSTKIYVNELLEKIFDEFRID